MFQIAELSRSKEALREKALRALSDAGIDRKDMGEKSDKVKIVFSQLKESDAAILGASALAWEL